MIPTDPFRIAALFVWLIATSIGPGLFFVRRFHWKPLETLCASVAVSLGLVYVCSFGIYVANLPVVPAHRILSAGCWLLTIASWRDLRQLLIRRRLRRALGAFAFLWSWTLLQAAIIRNFTGGDLILDWVEHYKRCLFFLEHWDAHYLFLNMYLITARPPVMNLVCAHYMALFGKDFFIYQLAAGFLNVLPVLACILWATTGVRRAWGTKGTLVALVFLLATNALLMENIAFAWTKSFTAFPILLSIWFYLRGWAKRDEQRMIAAFALAALACLCHYYAVCWAVALGLHYLLIVWPSRQKKNRELLQISAITAVILCTWLLWSFRTFGLKSSFTSNTTAWAVSAETPAERLRNYAYNYVTAIVPHFMRDVPYTKFAQSDSLGLARDLIFCTYQTSLPFAWGLFGGLILLLHLRNNSAPKPIRRFWLWLLFSSAALGIATISIPDPWEAMSLWGLPHVYLGVCALAVLLGRLSRPWRIFAACGCAIDFLGGILLQVYLEHRDFDTLRIPGVRLPILVGKNLPNALSQQNIVAKHFLGYRFLGDFFPDAVRLELLLCVAFAAMWIAFIRQARRHPARLFREELHAA
jgi:dolichyl-phosphate-mannose-protein mannosyltransferase